MVTIRSALAERLHLVDVGLLADVVSELRDRNTTKPLALVDHGYVGTDPVLVRHGKAIEAMKAIIGFTRPTLHRRFQYRKLKSAATPANCRPIINT